MSFEIIVFLLCLLGWLGAMRLLYVARSLPRIFGALIMSVWLYISVILVLISWNAALEVMLFFGVLPVVMVAYGYRVYDHYEKQAKLKNDQKLKNDAA